MHLFGGAAFIALVLLQTVIVAGSMAIGVAARKRSSSRYRWLILPFALLAAEFVRGSVPFGGFTWGGFGYSQHDNLILLRFAPYAGVWGVSLAVLLANAMLAEGIWSLSQRSRVPIRWAAGLAGIALLGLILPSGAAEGASAKLAMVQGDAPEGTVDPSSDDLTVIKNHLRVTAQLREKVDLVVWPESSIEIDPRQFDEVGDALSEMTRFIDAPLLAGATLDADADGPRKLRNVSLFYSRQGFLEKIYDKQHLVPFGEYVPLRKLLVPLVDELQRVPYDIVPGKNSTVFSIPKGQFASVICFESTFPGLVRDFVKNGARLLVVSTNNSTFERTALSDQHVAFSQLRAAEHRMWVAHAALTGVSAVVSPEGEVLARTKLFEQALVVPTVRFAQGLTPYGRYGDWLPILTTSALFLAFAMSLIGSRPHTPPPPPDRSALIVMPTYNEAADIEEILQELMALEGHLDVLVVDDGSPDGTAGLVEELARRYQGRVNLMSRARKQGLGRAYVDGFGWGLERGYTFLLEMDADLSHDPKDVPRLIGAAHEADLVIGSRYVPGGGVSGWSRSRHLLSRAGNAYARLLLRLPVADSTSGFRCFRAEVLQAIRLSRIKSDGYAFQIEMTHRALLAGFVVKEIPILFHERAHGTSKMSREIVREAILSVPRWALTRRSTTSSRRLPHE